MRGGVGWGVNGNVTQSVSTRFTVFRCPAAAPSLVQKIGSALSCNFDLFHRLVRRYAA